MCRGAVMDYGLSETSSPFDRNQIAPRRAVVPLNGALLAGRRRHEGFMMDMIFLAAGVAFFAAAIGYTLICERL